MKSPSGAASEAINAANKRRVWQTFLVVLVFYTAWVSPFEFGYLRKPTAPLEITDNIVNVFFAIDIVLTFFVAYLHKSSYLLINEPKLIALKYARTGLVFDMISTIPSRFFMSDGQGYSYFSMLRLWLIRKVSIMFERMEKDKNYSYIMIRIAKLTCVIFFQFIVLLGTFICLLIGTTTRITHGLRFQKKIFMNCLCGTCISIMSTYCSLVNIISIYPVNTGEMLFDYILLAIHPWAHIL